MTAVEEEKRRPGRPRGPKRDYAKEWQTRREKISAEALQDATAGAQDRDAVRKALGGRGAESTEAQPGAGLPEEPSFEEQLRAYGAAAGVFDLLAQVTQTPEFILPSDYATTLADRRDGKPVPPTAETVRIVGRPAALVLRKRLRGAVSPELELGAVLLRHLLRGGRAMVVRWRMRRQRRDGAAADGTPGTATPPSARPEAERENHAGQITTVGAPIPPDTHR